MKAVRPFETVVNIYQSTRHNISEDMNIHHGISDDERYVGYKAVIIYVFMG
jgi:hypothetical protein